MTEIQQEHSKAVEELSSRLAAVRRELCPAFISDGRFWKIYFVLLHSRLSKEDAELLSTSQVRTTSLLSRVTSSNFSVQVCKLKAFVPQECRPSELP